MKKIFNVLAFAIVAIFFNSCEKNGSLDEPKTYTVSFAASGDISCSMSPMTKADLEEGDLIGIRVYVSSDGETYTNYAYGLFDDIANASIELVEGKLYKFTALYTKDGKNRLHYHSAYDDYYFNYGHHVKVTNKFSLDPIEDYVFSSRSPLSYITPVEIFYGRTEGVVPSQDLTVTIDLKALYSGLTFNVEWDDAITEGSIDVCFAKICPGRFSIEYPNTSYSTIVNHKKIASAMYDNIAGSLDDIISYVNYTKGDGSVTRITENISIPFELKTITTVNLKVKASTSDASIGVNVESVELANGETVNIDTTTDSNDAQIGTN